MAEDLKKRGNEAFSKGDWHKAIDLYGKAISQNPSNSVYYSNRAAANLKLDNWQDALKDCNDGLKINDRDKTAVKLWWRKGVAERNLGDLQLAKESLESGLRVDPENDTLKNELNSLSWQIKKQSRRDKQEISSDSGSKDRLRAQKENAAVKQFSSSGPQIVPITTVDDLPAEFQNLIESSANTDGLSNDEKVKEGVKDSTMEIDISLVSPSLVSESSTASFLNSVKLPSPSELTIYSLMHLMRSSPSSLKQVYKYFFDLPPTLFIQLTGSAGIEPELLEFVLDSSIDQEKVYADKQSWCQRTVTLLEALAKTSRFSIARAFVSSTKTNQLLNLLRSHGFVNHIWIES